jgi:hypothetical protein
MAQIAFCRPRRPLSRWLKIGSAHHDLGANHFDRCPPQIRVKPPVARLAKLGYQVQLQPLPQAA